MTRGDIVGLGLSYVYAFGLLFGVEALGKKLGSCCAVIYVCHRAFPCLSEVDIIDLIIPQICEVPTAVDISTESCQSSRR